MAERYSNQLSYGANNLVVAGRREIIWPVCGRGRAGNGRVSGVFFEPRKEIIGLHQLINNSPSVTLFEVHNVNALMKNVQSLLIVLIVAITFADCKKNGSNDPQATTCQPPTMMVAQASCESGYPGALLTASNYKGVTPQFDYKIFLQKDTLSSDLTTSVYENASNERIFIAETVLKTAPKFVVKVYIHCSTSPQQDSSPAYFAFVKRPTANLNCYSWVQQKL